MAFHLILIPDNSIKRSTPRVSDTFDTNEQQSNLGDRFTPDKQSCDPVIPSLLPHTPSIYRNYRMFINANNTISIFFHSTETVLAYEFQ